MTAYGLAHARLRCLLAGGVPEEVVRDALQPFVTAVPAPPAGPCLEVDELRSAVRVPDGAVPVRTFLGETGRRWRDGPWTRIAADGGRALVHVRGDHVRAELSASLPNVARRVLQLVRELLVAQLVDDGAVRLHAAAVARDDRVVLLCGASGAGKSTTVAELLGLGFSYVGNDRVLLLPGRDGWTVHGLPIAARLTPLQLGTLPGGRRFMQRYAETSELRKTDESGGLLKYELTHAELARTAGRPVVTGGRVAAVVDVARGPGGGAALTPLGDEEVLAAVARVALAEDPAFPEFYRAPRAAGRAGRPLAVPPGLAGFRGAGPVDSDGLARLIDRACGAPLPSGSAG